VAFDEYHFGFGRGRTGGQVVGGLLFRNPAGWAVLCLTAAGLFYLVYRGRRFGTRRAPGRPRRRSKLEFVRSVGATYKAAGAHGLTFALLYESFRSKVAGRFGLSASAGAGEIAAAIAGRTGKAADGYEVVLSRCEEAVDTAHWAGERPSGRWLATMIRDLSRIELEVFNGRPERT